MCLNLDHVGLPVLETAMVRPALLQHRDGLAILGRSFDVLGWEMLGAFGYQTPAGPSARGTFKDKGVPMP